METILRTLLKYADRSYRKAYEEWYGEYELDLIKKNIYKNHVKDLMKIYWRYFNEMHP